ncbi:MAG: 50S ribosomal protein L24, partial [Clostridia bacterium]|nr:50S ribosomal protein L24 [Clostridia bacterium]
MNVKLNDTVVVISGKDKGTEGKVIACFPKLNRATVQGVNMVTRHQKARNQAQPGGIIHKEMPVDASNLMVKCPKCHVCTPCPVCKNDQENKPV